MILETFLIVALLAFICEWIDSAIGMGYGTILSPVLVILGFPPLLVVPSILITQALGGFSASIFHHKQGNARFCFRGGMSDDTKTVFYISSLGVFAVILAVFIGSAVSKTFLSTYIGILVLIMGLLILLNFRFAYSTGKMLIVGIVSAFNKGLSGGGFGPIVTGGQIVLGKEHKQAIACTTAAEPLICFAGFITYLILKGMPDFSLIFSLGAGAILAGPAGALTTKKIKRSLLKKIVGILMVFLGIIVLLRVFGILNINISI